MFYVSKIIIWLRYGWRQSGSVFGTQLRCICNVLSTIVVFGVSSSQNLAQLFTGGDPGVSSKGLTLHDFDDMLLLCSYLFVKIRQ